MDQLGVVYPITVYNNSHQPIELKVPQVVIEPNQFYHIDAKTCLDELRKTYPEGVPIAKGKLYYVTENKQLENKVPYETFFEQMGYSVDSQGEPKIVQEHEMHAEANKVRAELHSQVDNALDILDHLLPRYSPEDRVVSVNREHQKNASPEEKFIEITQEKLKEFIQNKVLKGTDAERLPLLVKAYNLQYRLRIYKEIAQNPEALLNRAKLREDILWAQQIEPAVKQLLTHA